MIESVEWGEYRLGDLFDKVEVSSLKYKTSELPSIPSGRYVLPALTAGIQNQGLNNYVPKEGATILKNVISISANGANTGVTFYQPHEFTILQDAYAIQWIYSTQVLSPNVHLFITSAISSVIYGKYEWTNKAGWRRVCEEYIQLPTRKGEIDFMFMERFVARLNAQRLAELNAYLSITGLKDYTLTPEEEQAVKDFEEGKDEWGEYRLGDLFGEATRGKRLKSEDRISGNLPFVTAGEADMGVSAFIGNDVEVFQPNTITIDMFGSAKYRNHTYGADDHVAVVHTQNLPKHAVCFITSAIHKVANSGDFHYGRNFYAKDAAPLIVSLFECQGSPDYGRMETFISAIEKLVIKDVVLYANREIEATKNVIDKTSKSNPI